MKKLLSLFLAILMVLSLLSGCMNLLPLLNRLTDAAVTDPTQLYEPVVTNPTDLPVSEKPVATTEVEGYEKHLNYTLNQEDVDAFYAGLAALEDALLNGDDWETAEKLEDDLDEIAFFINGQQSVAYILMSVYSNDKTYSDYYTESTEIMADAIADYIEMERELYHSDSSLKEQYFADWTEAEIQQMLCYTGEVAELEKRNAQILVEYRGLDEETMPTEMIPLYRELVLNNNRIAVLNGYEDYYDYAYAVSYSRDYDPQQVQVMRRYVKDYLIPSFFNIASITQDKINKLSKAQIRSLNNLLFDKPFDEMGVNYVDMYLASLPDSARDGMQALFRENRAVFAKTQEAHNSAFTTQVNDGLMCYFGPDYQVSMTAVHEMGHFYAINSFLKVNDNMGDISLDLAEVHSQSNEWLFTGFLKGILDKPLYDTLVYYKIYDDLAGIIIQMCIDEFEERVYNHPDVASLTEEDFDDIMDDVCKEYGGVNLVQGITDIQWYWRLVALESPCYYVSYAVSCVAALDVYFRQAEDYDGTVQIYCDLIDNVTPDGGFLSNLERVGLSGPFEKDVYEAIAALAGY